MTEQELIRVTTEMLADYGQVLGRQLAVLKWANRNADALQVKRTRHAGNPPG